MTLVIPCFVSTTENSMNVSTKNLRHVSLELPLPPHDPDRRSTWEKRALAEIKTQLAPGHEPMTGFIKIRLRAGIDDRRLEIARATVPILRLLAAVGVIDGPVSDSDSKWDRITPVGRVHLKIAQTVGPLSRVPAIARRRAGERGGQRRVAERDSTAA